MLERLEATRRELDSVIDSLRSGAGSFDSELVVFDEAQPEPVHDGVGEAVDQAAPGAVDQAAPGAVDQAAPGAVDQGAPVAVDEAALAAADQGAPGAADEASPAEPAAAPHADDDAEGARLIALNMALNGTPREETAKYLSEHFHLSDRDGLLDEVYSSVGG